MLSAVTNLIVHQGADFESTFFVTKDNGSNFDLTGYSGASLIKKHYDSSTSTTMVVDITSPPSMGAVKISLTNAVTAGMHPGKYVYDVVLTSNTGIKCILHPQVFLTIDSIA